MKIVFPKKDNEVCSVRHRYFQVNDNSGFSFPCNEKGEVLERDLHPFALSNFRPALRGERGTDRGIIFLMVRFSQPAVGHCECNTYLKLENVENQCKCGRVYGLDGQLL